MSDSIKIYLDAPPAELAGRAALFPRTRHLVSFHSGYPYSLAAERLKAQALAAGWFAGIDILHPALDHPAMRAFVAQHGEFVQRHVRGFGYWRWKPFLVEAVLRTLPEGAHLYYMDAGCELSKLGAHRFAALDDELARRGVLCFEIAFREIGWSKREAAEAIFGGWNPAAMAARQIQATWFGLCNTAATRALVAEWTAWAVQGDLITDAHDSGRQDAAFRGHRHDQSLWSLVLKKRGMQPLPQEDCFEKWLYVPDSWVLLAPVHGLRTRGAGSRLDAVVARSSEESCRSNLAVPSLPFKTWLALARLSAHGLALLRSLRALARSGLRRRVA